MRKARTTAKKNKLSKKKLVLHLGMLIVLGMQTMIVELTIPRILAPAFGNTLFCWTAIITVVLISLTLGYYIGGKLTAKKKPERLIRIFGAVSAALVVGLAFLGESITSALSGLDLISGPLLSAFILAAFPTGFGAMVVPLVVDTLSAKAGEAAGLCYAWSTVGSVLGILLTGYVLLPLLGISNSLVFGASFVFIWVIVSGRGFAGYAGIALIIAGLLIFDSEDATILYEKSNGYHRIRIRENPDFKEERTLYLDSTIEGAIIAGSLEPVLNYQRKIGEITQFIPNLSTAFFIGGGSFSMPKYIKSRFPDAIIDVVEIDPDVVEAADRYLELSKAINIIIGDGRQTLRNTRHHYNLIVNDAFNGVRKIPFHLVTKEFNGIVKNKLSDSGIYAINVIGHSTESSLVNSVTRTLLTDFEYVAFLHRKEKNVQNLWILASKSPIGLGISITPNELNKGQILTDDRAPVEFLIAKDLLGFSGI